jgi:hypothetical protein
MAVKKKQTIEGLVAYQDISGGFWGIVGKDGRQWRPVNMPEQLKVEGKAVRLTIQEADEAFSIFMWGTPVKILTFHT